MYCKQTLQLHDDILNLFSQGKSKKKKWKYKTLPPFRLLFVFASSWRRSEIKKPSFRWYSTALYRKIVQLNKEIPKRLIFCKPYHQPAFFGSLLSSFFLPLDLHFFLFFFLSFVGICLGILFTCYICWFKMLYSQSVGYMLPLDLIILPTKISIGIYTNNPSVIILSTGSRTKNICRKNAHW
jgi:hypothetical protein